MTTVIAKPTHKRSRNGCKTCKRRRRKCDEARPECNRCTTDGLECEGYSISLVWRVEKQRVGSSNDSKEAAAVALARQSSVESSSSESLERDSVITEILQNAHISLSTFERRVLDEFISTGRYDLHSRDHNIPPLEEFITNICSSKAAVQACIAMELAMSGQKEEMMHYFTSSLAEFREVLHNLHVADYPGVLAAAVLICCCAFCTQQPWRVHLNGILAIVESRQAKYVNHPGVEWSLQCMCLYDMDILRISPTPELQSKFLWKHYCMNKKGGIQAVTGMPMSLIHIISSLRWNANDAIHSEYLALEPKLWAWNDEEPSSALDNSLWDAWRYAALLFICDALGREESQIHSILTRILSAVMQITWYCDRFRIRTPNSIFWPTIVAATSRHLQDSHKKFICEMWEEDGIMLATPTLRMSTNRRIWDLIQEVWKTGATPQEVVMTHGWTEICLL